MTLDKILVAIVGFFGIIFTYWFFLMKKEKPISRSKSIIVDGGYNPEVISISKGKTTRLTFIRKDPTECLEEIVMSDFRIRKHLPLNKPVTIEITPEKRGEYKYSCGMNMYHGKIVVE